MSKGRFRADQISSQPIPTTTLLEISSIIALFLEIGGPGRLMIPARVRKKNLYHYKLAYIRLSSQTYGNGRGGFSITPTCVSPSSLASKWASAPPDIVKRIGFRVWASTSCFNITNVAIISALCASTTRGISP